MNAKTAAHTPTPWYADGKLIVGATPDDGQIGGAHDPTDAAFIVKACNAHDELVALAQEVSNHFSRTAHPLGIAAADLLARVDR